MASLFKIPRTISSGKPLRMRNVVQHRSDYLINYQLQNVCHSQDVFRMSLEQLDALQDEHLIEKFTEIVENHKSELREMLLIAQIASKIKGELTHARASLKKALKLNVNIYGARKRLIWLESQLEYLIMERCPKPLCNLDPQTLLTPEASPPPLSPSIDTPEPTPEPDINEEKDNIKDALDRMNSHIMTREELDETWQNYKQKREAPKVEIDYDLMLETAMTDLMDSDQEDDDETISKLAGLGFDLGALGQPVCGHDSDSEQADDESGETDTKSGGLDARELSAVGDDDTEPDVVTQEVHGEVTLNKETFLTEIEQTDLTTTEVTNDDKVETKNGDNIETEAADKVDNGRTGNIDIDQVVSPEIGLATGSGSPRSEEEEGGVSRRSEEEKEGVSHLSEEEVHSHSQLSRASLKEEDDIRQLSGQEDEDDESVDFGRDYWHSEHHRFYYSDHAQTLLELDPLSYHQVGLALPGTFIKSAPATTPVLPWFPPVPGEIHDVHRVALDKLSIRVQKMYEHIFDAAKSSVDPNHKQVKDRGNFLQTRTAEPAAGGRLTSGEGARDQVSPKLPPIDTRTAPHMALKFHSKPIPQAKRLPVSELNLDGLYPRSSVHLAHTDLTRRPKVERIVNQRNLYNDTKLIIYVAKNRKISDDGRLELTIPAGVQIMDSTNGSHNKLRKPANVMKAASALANSKSVPETTDVKWNRVQELLNCNLKSSRDSDRAEAARQLGLLGSDEACIIAELEKCLIDDSALSVRYQSAKALVLLGEFNDEVLSLLIKYLIRGGRDVRLDVIRALSYCPNAGHIIDKNLYNFCTLSKVLVDLVTDDASGHIAFNAAVCLANLGVKSELAEHRLKRVLNNHSDHHLRAEALSTLVMKMSCHESDVTSAILKQLESSPVWRHRAEAGRLLIKLGPRIVCKQSVQDNTINSDNSEQRNVQESKLSVEYERVYELLERRLWDESNSDVRRIIAHVVTAMGMAAKACERAERKLGDPDEAVRAQGAISVGTLRFKKKNVMKTLLEMVELDASDYVRLQVIKTFGLLSLRDKKVVRSLKDRMKAGGSLGSEAMKVLKQLGEYS